jgi:tetratricopeptide (TPR) repeat protein
MKVFLSSTGHDLRLHREAAFRALQGMDHQCVRMEDFHFAAIKIKDFDDQRIAVCDLFVILLGQLYGTCPEDCEKSYTEMEYETAVKLKKPYFLFLSDEDHPLTTIREPDAQNENLRAFRQRAAGLIRNSFTTPEDLATHIVQAIHNWQQTADRPNQPAAFLPLPPQPYFVHPYPLQPNFTGRLKERRMLTDWLTRGTNLLSISAIGGMGKSALTWAWLQRDVLGLPLPGTSEPETDSPRLPESARPEGVLWWSFYETKATFAAFVREALQYASIGRTVFDDPLHALLAFLAQKRYLLILDGFERELRAYAGLNAAYQGDDGATDADLRTCIDPHAAAFLPWMASAPIPSRVLLTTRLHPRELDNLAGCRQIDLNALDPDDAVSFFQAQQIRGTRAEIQAVCAPYGYHPLALRLLSGVIVKDHSKPRDIAVAGRHPISKELTGRAKHHILQVAYDTLDQPKRNLLNLQAAFRNPMSHDSLAAMNPFASERELDDALDDLIERGLLFRSETQYNLHPIVRQHAYERLTDKPNVHTRLRDYFTKLPAQDKDKIESVDDLGPVIELYHHTVRAGQYDEACDLFYERLSQLLYYRFGAYQLRIDLLRGLFPDGEDSPPRLKTEGDQSWTLNALSNSYSVSGQSGHALPLLRMANAIYEKVGDKKEIAIGLTNLALAQQVLGQLREADQSLRKQIELTHEIQDEFKEAVGHNDLGLLEAYQARFKESFSELDAALPSFRKQNVKQSECVVWAHRALRALLMEDPPEALDAARRSRELADVKRYERDIIRAEWLLGWAQIAQSPAKAEHHLVEALTRCRRINNVELEPSILLAFARLHLARDDRPAALTHANDALAIADRCEYRLVQADCHNLLAQIALADHDHPTARHHAEIARERAWCDGPPHCYKPALDEAEDLLRSLPS